MNKRPLVLSIAFGLLMFLTIAYSVRAKTADSFNGTNQRVFGSTVKVHNSVGTVSVAPFRAETHSAYVKLLARPSLSALSQYVVIVTNTSGYPITGLTMHWTATGDRGLVSRVDSYSSAEGLPVIATGGQAAVWPTGHLSENEARLHEDRFPLLSLPPKPLIARWEGKQVNFELDAVILENGNVWGSDTFRTGAYIHNRNAAALSISKRLHHAIENGENLPDVIRQIASSSDRGGMESTAWFTNYYASLLQTRGPTKMLKYLDSLPNVPIFTNTDANREDN